MSLVADTYSNQCIRFNESKWLSKPVAKVLIPDFSDLNAKTFFSHLDFIFYLRPFEAASSITSHPSEIHIGSYRRISCY